MVFKTDDSYGCPLVTVLSEETRTSLANKLINNEISAKDISESFDVGPRTPYGWMYTLKRKRDDCIGIPTLSSSSLGGNLDVLDSHSKDAFKSEVTARQSANKSVGEDEGKKLFVKEMNETKVL